MLLLFLWRGVLLCISSTEINHKTSDHDMFPFIGGAYCGQGWRVLREIIIIARVSGRVVVVVVVVVVRELFSLVTSAICVRVRGQRLRRLFTT